ncbi:vesicle-fusing ATPase [Salvia divinorum]|uniref:Vesicle-fusing ATPase n=1 Tax=Salvia divinorum TaxID=28513 RepID=A0ABD1IHA3_SALDI
MGRREYDVSVPCLSAFMIECDIREITYNVRTLKIEDAKKVLQQLNVFSNDGVESAAEALNDIPLKKLYMVVEMAAQGEHGGSAEAIYSGKAKINISHFFECLQNMLRINISTYFRIYYLVIMF